MKPKMYKLPMNFIVKLLLWVIILFSGVTSSNAQTIKDYYIPDRPNNKATFYTPNMSGEKSEGARAIYYIMHSTYYNIVDTKWLNKKMMSITTLYVDIYTDQVRMTESRSSTVLYTDKRNTYSPSRIILKMPPVGKSVAWSYIDVPGDNIKCVASWKTVLIEGVQKKAIKVVKEFEGMNAKMIEYYVQGIGLWKVELQGTDGKVQAYNELESLEYYQ